jgi:hypothetical protein
MFVNTLFSFILLQKKGRLSFRLPLLKVTNNPLLGVTLLV